MVKSRHRPSPIPSGGLEVRLKLTFEGLGDIVYKMDILIRILLLEYTGELRETEIRAGPFIRGR